MGCHCKAALNIFIETVWYKYVYEYCMLKDKNGVPLLFHIVCDLGISMVPLFSWTIEFIFVRVNVPLKKSLHQVRR